DRQSRADNRSRPDGGGSWLPACVWRKVFGQCLQEHAIASGIEVYAIAIVIRRCKTTLRIGECWLEKMASRSRSTAHGQQAVGFSERCLMRFSGRGWAAPRRNGDHQYPGIGWNVSENPRMVLCNFCRRRAAIQIIAPGQQEDGSCSAQRGVAWHSLRKTGDRFATDGIVACVAQRGRRQALEVTVAKQQQIAGLHQWVATQLHGCEALFQTGLQHVRPIQSPVDAVRKALVEGRKGKHRQHAQ
ncbi:MAG TPA: hypothetical protein PLW86_05600, partial [Rhodocyclaceae bacterium]|nr:hypothetical protein [Rhodocyclaceae bacterium]